MIYMVYTHLVNHIKQFIVTFILAGEDSSFHNIARPHTLQGRDEIDIRDNHETYSRYSGRHSCTNGK